MLATSRQLLSDIRPPRLGHAIKLELLQTSEIAQEGFLPTEKRLQLVIIAINDGTVPSVRQAANLFGIPRSTLGDRLHSS
jgi:hypothetical protein